MIEYNKKVLVEHTLFLSNKFTIVYNNFTGTMYRCNSEWGKIGFILYKIKK